MICVVQWCAPELECVCVGDGSQSVRRSVCGQRKTDSCFKGVFKLDWEQWPGSAKGSLRFCTHTFQQQCMSEWEEGVGLLHRWYLQRQFHYKSTDHSDCTP